MLGAKLGLVLLRIDTAGTVGLPWGAFGAFMGHRVPKIHKLVTYLISEVDLVESRVFPPGTQPAFGVWLPCGP